MEFINNERMKIALLFFRQDNSFDEVGLLSGKTDSAILHESDFRKHAITFGFQSYHTQTLQRKALINVISNEKVIVPISPFVFEILVEWLVFSRFYPL